MDVADFLAMGRKIDALHQFQSLIDDSRFNVWFSYGQNVPVLPADFLFWGAGKFAYSMKTILPEMCLMSPGAEWLNTLPPEFLGRTIYSEPFATVVEKIKQDTVWFKFAEMKHDAFTAKQYTGSELQELFIKFPELGSTKTQWTRDILSLNYEHRFFVLDGKPITGSPYLIDGVLYSGSIPWNRFADAEKFAAQVAGEVNSFSPPAYVLDVAFDTNSDQWIVVEANRVWSSGLYGSDVYKFVEALKVSLLPSEWEWLPDEAVLSYANKVTIVEDDSSVSGLFKF